MERLVNLSREETVFAMEVFSRSSSVLGTVIALSGHLALRATCKTKLKGKLEPVCKGL